MTAITRSVLLFFLMASACGAQSPQEISAPRGCLTEAPPLPPGPEQAARATDDKAQADMLVAYVLVLERWSREAWAKCAAQTPKN